MKTVKKFIPGIDRYHFDFGACTSVKGYAQVDTEQDASYYGTWANPFELRVVSYAEGDIHTSTAENVEEFVSEIREIKRWNDEQGWAFLGIDPGFNEELANRFLEIGLGDLLH